MDTKNVFAICIQGVGIEETGVRRATGEIAVLRGICIANMSGSERSLQLVMLSLDSKKNCFA